MNQETFLWALFMAILGPLVMAVPGQALAVTVAHMCVCLGMVAVADRLERT